VLRMWEVFHESEGRRAIVLGFLKSVYGVCFLLFFFFFCSVAVSCSFLCIACCQSSKADRGK
jgi:hypothetical protein